MPPPTDRRLLPAATTRCPEILYAKPSPNDNLADVAVRDLPKELRERYWIGQAADASTDAKTRPRFEVAIPWQIERAEFGRNRNEPGDGFRYVFRQGTEGTGGRAEWFEVTEVFEGVDAKDVEAFMRLANGGRGYPGFDSEGFLGGLNLGMPTRAAQRRAADTVIAAVERKLTRASYEGLWRTHGYGTLIVGLPLWCATPPAGPTTAGERRRRLHDTGRARSQAVRAATAAEKLPFLAPRGRLEDAGREHAGMDTQSEAGRIRAPRLQQDWRSGSPRRVADAAG